MVRFWLIALGVFVLLLWLLRGVLLPFAAGAAAAYFLDPLADRLERLGLSRIIATTVITFVFVLLVVAVLLLVVPVLENQIVAFAQRLPGYAEALQERAAPLWKQVRRYLTPSEIQQLKGAAGDYAGTAVGWVAALFGRVLTGGAALVNILSLLFITPVVTFYLLRDWDLIKARIDSWLPRAHAPVIRDQLRQIDTTLAGFLRGQATVCLVLGAFYGIGLTVVGLDLGLIVGFTAGLVSFIPYLGSISGFVVGVGMALAQGDGWALPGMVAGVFLVGQLIEGNFLTPKLVGDKVGLHPVWIIFALLAGGSLFGFLGILLAVPVAAVVGVLVRFALAGYLNSPIYLGVRRPGPDLE